MEISFFEWKENLYSEWRPLPFEYMLKEYDVGKLLDWHDEVRSFSHFPVKLSISKTLSIYMVNLDLLAVRITLIENTRFKKSFNIHQMHPMCNPLMCNIFLSNLCFAPCPLCATVKKILYSKMTKMNRNELNIVFTVIKLTSKAVFHHLYQNILPLFTINWPVFFKMGKKSLFFAKNFISIY